MTRHSVFEMERAAGLAEIVRNGLRPEGEKDFLIAGQKALLAEAEALRLAAARLDESFNRAVSLILRTNQKVVITGLGKSGHIARKIAATLCSTGTPAVFLHAAEATHGDLGIYNAGDPTILLSKSGATTELLRLVPVLRSLGSPMIGILGNVSSPLAAEVEVLLDARVSAEADPHDLVPTCSSAVAMGLGDALAVALMHARQFTQLDFMQYHPCGQLGRNLWLTVSDVMHREVAFVSPEHSLRHAVIAMTEHPLGGACVIDANSRLAGIVTDGDLRRTLQKHEEIAHLRVSDIMTPHPVTVSPKALLKEAETLMERPTSQLSVLPVVDENERCLGLIRIHDLYRRSD